MSFALGLKPICEVCGNKFDLYGNECKHMTLCYSCGQKMAENCVKCYDCGTPSSRLIREYIVQDGTKSEASWYLARFPMSTKLPNFSNKLLHKEGVEGHHVAKGMREKYKNKPWILEDEKGEQYRGQIDATQGQYYVFVQQGGELVAYPVVSWNTFNKIAQYKQLTLEEAEKKMNNRKRSASGSEERWMMKTAGGDSTAVDEGERSQSPQKGAGKDQKEGPSRKSRLWVHKRNDNDDEEGLRGGDLDVDDDDFDKGDDWEHDEIFTDDDEAVGHEPQERDEIDPDVVPVPREIEQDEDDDEGNEEGSKLTKSGKELKKLLGLADGETDSDDDDFDDLSDDDDDDIKGIVKEELADKGASQVAATKSSKTKRKAEEDDYEGDDGQKAKKIKIENTLPVSAKSKIKAEEVVTEVNRATTAKKIKTENAPLRSNLIKREAGEDDLEASKPKIKAEEVVTEGNRGTTAKKIKTENAPPRSSMPKIKVEEDDIERGDGTTPTNIKTDSSNIQPVKRSSSKAGATPTAKTVTEEEIRASFKLRSSMTSSELVKEFRERLKFQKNKQVFKEIIRRICSVEKNSDGTGFFVLKDL